MATRRTFIQHSLAGARTFALAAAPGTIAVAQERKAVVTTRNKKEFWPNGARLAVSVCMQFEGGGQPISGAPGPIGEPIAPGVPDLTQNTYYEYGPNEGIPRMLDLFDRHGVKVTSFMIGEAVDKHPDLAKEIVRRGHEAANHGRRWAFQYLLPPEEEKAWIASGQRSIEKATGATPLGYDCYWMRGSVRTLELLQELGYIYHNNDLSRDEPYVQEINGKPLVAVPYTAHLNDIASFNYDGYNPDAYVRAVCDEFDQLYSEAGTRRRMMSISLHDRISGRPYRIPALERIFNHFKSRPGVWFARRDEIAHHALATPDLTLKVERPPAPMSGLPGPSH
jgi:peptidoglycan/xylan/chitin deacetylase (PgdA/CDA1 family)